MPTPGLRLGSLAKIPSLLGLNWSSEAPLVGKSDDLEASKEVHSSSPKHRCIHTTDAILFPGQAQRQAGLKIYQEVTNLRAAPLKVRELGAQKWGQ